jgi:hypothetical protein
MDRQELRLEIVKLTYTHGREITEAVARAKALEAYILDESEKKESSQNQVSGKLKKPT